MEENKIKLTIRIIGVFAFITIFFCFLILDIDFANHYTIEINPNNFKPQASTLFPESRINVDEDIWQVIDEPIYFTTRISNLYDTVKVHVKYKNNCCQNITIGMQTANGWDYEQALLDNKDFNELSWPAHKLDDLTIWEKPSSDSEVDILDGDIDINIDGNVASYESNANKAFLIDDYTDYAKAQVIRPNLTFNYSFLVYIKNDLALSFELSDISESPTIVSVFDMNNNRINELLVSDLSFLLTFASLKEGLYKISIEHPDGIYTKAITSKHKYINFINELNFVGNNFSLVTNASTMRWQAFDWPGLQTINYGEFMIAIDELNKKYYIRDLGKITYINIPIGNITVYSDGLISFTDDYLLPHIPNKVTQISNDSEFDYLVAKYNKPIIEQGWSLNKAQFNINKAYIQGFKLRFMIGALGADKDNPFLIDSIKIIYEKKSDSYSVLSEIIKYIKYWHSQIR